VEDFGDRSFLSEVTQYQTRAKKQGDYDYLKGSSGKPEVDPRTFPDGLYVNEVIDGQPHYALNLGATCVYNYEVNYEQQLKINELEAKVLDLETRLSKLEGG